MTEEGIVALKSMILERARGLLPKPGAIALHQRHRSIISAARDDLDRAISSTDLLITAEHLRAARNMLDRLTGKAGVEDMLDTLFGGMCIGK
jgi:tRNA modification GTPase